jgi:hypothetical protein
MEAAAHSHDHHEMPTSGRALTNVAVSATLHCLTGCALGEIAGMIIGTAFGWSNGGTIAISIALAFVFGYSLTSLPLLRAGLALSAVVPVALASDTLSIATMELVDNVIMVTLPGAMNAGLGDLLFWGSLSFALVVAGVAAVPVNRWLLARGKGHAAVHETGIHGGPPVRLVAVGAAVAAVFGTTVLVTDAIWGKDSMHGGGHSMSGGHSSAGHSAGQDAVRGLAASEGGMTLALEQRRVARGRTTELGLRILGADGRPVRDFEVTHEKRMHLIVARRDLTNFQHLHPRLGADGTWRTPVAFAEAGGYRVFADFKRGARNVTLGADLTVDGPVRRRDLPPPSATARTGDGYEVRMDGTSTAGRASELRFRMFQGGRPVTVQPYLGAGGHLVALRQADLAYLHVHPTSETARGPIAFATEFPTAGRYRLFLQFKHGGAVHTASFTRDVRDAGTQHDGGHHGE